MLRARPPHRWGPIEPYRCPLLHRAQVGGSAPGGRGGAGIHLPSGIGGKINLHLHDGDLNPASQNTPLHWFVQSPALVPKGGFKRGAVRAGGAHKASAEEQPPPKSLKPTL